MTNKTIIRTAASPDIDRICEIDTDASANFASIPALKDLAEGSHGCLEPDTVQKWMNDGCIYVIEAGRTMLGFTAVQPRDGVLYIAELSVLQSHQGRGLGSQLLHEAFAHARAEAREAGSEVSRVSLTTYPDVPWNGPWYRRRGFEEVGPASLGSWHVEKVRQDEVDLARLGYRRCCMLREEALDAVSES